MNRLTGMAFVLAFFAGLAGTAAKERVWTDNAGRTMRAEFVREVDGDVTFLRGGKLVTIPLDRLTVADQQMVRDLASGKLPPEDVPVTPQEGEFGSSEVRSNGDSPSQPASSGSAPLLPQPIPIENRVWTDIHGNQTTARYVRIFGSNVVLSRGGRSITVKYHELTTGDQEYLKELLASRGQEAMIPPAVTDLSSLQPAQTDRDSTNATQEAAGSGDSSAEAAAGPLGSDAGTTSGVPDSASPFGPVRSGIGSDITPPGRPMAPASPPPGSASAGFAPAATAVPPGMSSPVASGMSSYPTNSGLPGAASYENAMSSSSALPSDPGERLTFAPPQSGSYSPSYDPLVGTCSSCRRSVTQSQSTASHCQHCGIRWDYKEDPFTRQKLPIPRLNTAAVELDPRAARTLAIVVGAFVGLLVVVGLIIGVIYAVMGLASVSSAPRDRQMPR